MEDNIITIRKRDKELALSAFDDFMSKTEKYLNIHAARAPKDYATLSASDLERVSVAAMREIAPATPFKETDIQLVAGQSFPDIMAGEYYGVEVKSTKSNHWTSTGSSIVESTRNATVEEIYLLFGKLGGEPPEFKCRPYQECLYDITVTHSPRYLINMEIAKDETIFHKMGTNYDELRTSSNAIARVRSYYRQKAIAEKKNEMPWWISSDDEVQNYSNMNLRHIGTLTSTEKNDCVCQSLILFPNIICDSNPNRYINVALWLCTFNGILVSNMRDLFSSGGMAKYVDDTKLPYPLPGIVIRIVNNAERVKEMLSIKNIYSILEAIKENNPDLLSKGIDNTFEVWAEMMDANINTLLKSKGIPSVKAYDWIVNSKKLNINLPKL